MKPVKFFRNEQFGLPCWWTMYGSIYQNLDKEYLVWTGDKNRNNSPPTARFKLLKEAKAHIQAIATDFESGDYWRRYLEGKA